MNYLLHIKNKELCCKELGNVYAINIIDANKNAIITNDSVLMFVNSKITREIKRQFTTTTNPKYADWIVINNDTQLHSTLKKNYSNCNVLSKLCLQSTYEKIKQYYNLPEWEDNNFYIDLSCCNSNINIISDKCYNAIHDFQYNYYYCTSDTKHIFCTNENVNNKFILEEQVLDANENIIDEKKYENLKQMLLRDDTRNIAIKIVDSCNIKKSIIYVMKLIYNNRYEFGNCNRSLVRNITKTLGLTQSQIKNLLIITSLRILSKHHQLTKSAFDWFKKKYERSYTMENDNKIVVTLSYSQFDPEPEPIFTEEVQPKVNRDLFGEPMTIIAKPTTKLQQQEPQW